VLWSEKWKLSNDGFWTSPGSAESSSFNWSISWHNSSCASYMAHTAIHQRCSTLGCLYGVHSNGRSYVFSLFLSYFTVTFFRTADQDQNWGKRRSSPAKNWDQISARSVKRLWRERHFTTFIINGLTNKLPWTKRPSVTRLPSPDGPHWAMPQLSSFMNTVVQFTAISSHLTTNNK